MKLGYHGFGVGVTANPAVLQRVARHAEQTGYESLWTAEHVVLPDPQVPPSPSPPRVPFLDPAGVLCHAAAVTGWWRQVSVRLPAPALGAAYAVALNLALVLAPDAGKTFIYFQF